MKSVQSVGATMAPPLDPYVLRTALLARRISASASLAIVIADMAFGELRRDDVAMLAMTSASRIAAAGEVRS